MYFADTVVQPAIRTKSECNRLKSVTKLGDTTKATVLSHSK